MKKRDIINFVILIIVIVYAAYSYYNKTYTYNETEFLMDTVVNIKVKIKSKDAEEIVNSAFDMMRKMEEKLSCYQSTSIISKFNSGEIESLELDEDLINLFQVSEKIYSESDSLYDITIGSLADLWDFENDIIPSEDEIQKAIDYIGFDQLEFNEDNVKKPVGMKLNIGSLAKGFIIDKAVEFLISNGIESGFVNAGGDIRIFGQKKTLKIGIQHPRLERGELSGIVNVTNGSVVTSGDYERFFLKDGIRYHHILNPRTGYPADTAVSVTVISKKAVLADAYSTALFLLKPELAIDLANSVPEIEAIVFYIENEEINSIQTENMKQYMN
jgi:FAD:protein FMN transferase